MGWGGVLGSTRLPYRSFRAKLSAVERRERPSSGVNLSRSISGELSAVLQKHEVHNLISKVIIIFRLINVRYWVSDCTAFRPRSYN